MKFVAVHRLKFVKFFLVIKRRHNCLVFFFRTWAYFLFRMESFIYCYVRTRTLGKYSDRYPCNMKVEWKGIRPLINCLLLSCHKYGNLYNWARTKIFSVIVIVFRRDLL